MRQVNDMGKKDRCYLCGAKLQNGYCKECGLDNRRSQKIRYRLNEGNATKKNDSFEEMAEEQRETENSNIQRASNGISFRRMIFSLPQELSTLLN